MNISGVVYFTWWSNNNCWIWYLLLHLWRAELFYCLVICTFLDMKCYWANYIIVLWLKCHKRCALMVPNAMQCGLCRGFKMFVICDTFNLPLFMHSKTTKPSVFCCLHYATFPWHQFESSWFCSQQLWGQQIQLEPWTRQHHTSVRLFGGFQATAGHCSRRGPLNKHNDI